MDYTNEIEVDIAYQVLIEKKEPIYFKDLIMDVIEKKHRPVQSLSKSISEVYTLINMDSRFHHAGKGLWGLAEWTPQEVKRTHASASTTPKPPSKRRERLLEEIQVHDAVVKPTERE